MALNMELQSNTQKNSPEKQVLIKKVMKMLRIQTTMTPSYISEVCMLVVFWE